MTSRSRGTSTAKKHEGRELKKIPVGGSSESSHIDSRKRYRVKIEGRWYEGSFSRQWFGWNFDGYGSSGLQLNLIDEVYELVKPSKDKGKKGP
ncbi:MAG TPA: hypothetical protein VEN81_05820 [Planctomycetota bacterium]|nr:hypothetical protein [Planctomycetota bacterium]